MIGSLPHTLGYITHIGALGCGLLAIERLTRGKTPSLKIDAFLAAGCLVMAVASFLASDPPDFFEDFRIAYYPAGRAMLTDPTALHGLMDRGVSGFVNLPVIAYVFAPFAVLPPAPAMALFTALGLAAFYAAWRILASAAKLDRTGRWQLALLFAAGGPGVYSIREGNLSHMVLLALAMGLVLLRRGRSASAGIVLGLAAIFKPPLALMGLVFLLRRDGAGLAGFVLTGLTASLLSLALFGWAENLHWLQVCVLAFNHQWLAAFNVQSVPAFLLRLTSSPFRLMDWTGALPDPQLRTTAEVLVGAIFALAAVAFLRRPARVLGPAEIDERLDLTYLLLICLCVLTSPLSWSHYYVWLLAPVAFLLGPQALSAGLRWTAVLLLSPLVWPLNPASPALMSIYRTAWSSHLLLGGLVTLGLIAWRLANIGGATHTLPMSRGPVASWR